MKKLIENPVDENPAYNFAKDRHNATGKTRRFSGQPYFVHPEMVAELVAAYNGTEDQITAALLHDTVEDTDTTFDELEDMYGPGVAQIVSEITNEDAEVKRLGKEAYIDKELCELSDEALLVKCADCVINYLDHPYKDQKNRIVKNLKHLIDIKAEELPRNVKQLLKSIPELEEYCNVLDTNEYQRLSPEDLMYYD